MTNKDRMARAQDYVLGLMDEHERERAERDMVVDAEFRDCVFILAERMRRINRERPPAIPDGAWDDISERLAALPQMARPAAKPVPAENNTQARIPLRSPGTGVLRVNRPFAHHFAGWKGTVVGGALAVALTVGYLAGQAIAPAPRPLAAAILTDADRAPGAILEDYGNSRMRILPLTRIDVPEGQVLQLWSIDEGGAVPIGTLAQLGSVTLAGPDMAPPTSRRTYELTLEAAPGSTGSPSSQPILTGQAVPTPD